MTRGGRISDAVFLATCVLLLPRPASAVPEDLPNQVSFHLTGLNFAGYSGHLGSPSEATVFEIKSVPAPGAGLSYARRFSAYFELRPRFEYLLPLSLEDSRAPDWTHELRWVLQASGVLPLLDGHLDLALGVEGGAVLLAVERGSRSGTGVGGTVGPVLAARPWMTDEVGLFLELSAGYSGGSTSDDLDFQVPRILKGSLGVSYAF